ncbi:MAG: hypothetical protein S4CHLAM102_01190 [Chlamydiia bacterium]|nr:hypothetical protein [Chlamydiia bacterium]
MEPFFLIHLPQRQKAGFSHSSCLISSQAAASRPPICLKERKMYEQTYEKSPDSLRATIEWLSLLAKKQWFDRWPQAYKEMYDITKHFPSHQHFPSDDFLQFINLMGQYALYCENTPLAKNLFQLGQLVDNSHPALNELEEKIANCRSWKSKFKALIGA